MFKYYKWIWILKSGLPELHVARVPCEKINILNAFLLYFSHHITHQSSILNKIIFFIIIMAWFSQCDSLSIIYLIYSNPQPVSLATSSRRCSSGVQSTTSTWLSTPAPGDMPTCSSWLIWLWRSAGHPLRWREDSAHSTGSCCSFQIEDTPSFWWFFK